MKQQTFIFIGRSGCGKGTQADLMEDFLKKNDSEKRKVHHLVTGNFLRELAKGESFTGKVTADALSKGLLMPEFLVVALWGDYLIKNYEGNEHIITDGMPRKLFEAIMFEGALRFFGREKANVIYLNLSYESAVKRLLLRKREDDTEEAIRERLKFYDEEVAPVVDYYRKDPNINFYEIDGEPTIEEIHEDVKKKLAHLWEKK